MALHGPLKDIELNNHELYANLQLLKFEDIYRLEMSKFMHRCCHETIPLSFQSYFQKKSYNYNLRSLARNPFRTQMTHTEAYKRWLVNYGLHIWNEIEPDVKNLPYDPFKIELKKRILKSY